MQSTPCKIQDTFYQIQDARPIHYTGAQQTLYKIQETPTTGAQQTLNMILETPSTGARQTLQDTGYTHYRHGSPYKIQDTYDKVLNAKRYKQTKLHDTVNHLSVVHTQCIWYCIECMQIGKHYGIADHEVHVDSPFQQTSMADCNTSNLFCYKSLICFMLQYTVENIKNFILYSIQYTVYVIICFTVYSVSALI